MGADIPIVGKAAQAKAMPRKSTRRVTCLQYGPLSIDITTSTFTKNGRVIKLTPKETELLIAFMTHPGVLLTHALLIKEIWHTDFTEDMRMLYVHIRLLRKKIEDDPSRPVFVQTVRGRGYRFVAPESEETV